MSNKLEHSYQIIIQATPEQVWQALTDSRFTTQYFPYTVVEVDGYWRAAWFRDTEGNLLNVRSKTPREG